MGSSRFGRNLVKDRHPQFADDFGSVSSTLIKLGGSAKFTWQF